MKVESVEAYPIKIRMEEELRAGTFTYTHYQTVLVKVVCEGFSGWGEAMTRFDPAATALLVRYLASQIIGREYATPKDAWLSIWKELRIRGHTRGTDVEALSGIEIALYDCFGKLKRKPISDLLSKRAKPRVNVYAGSIFESRGPLEDQILQAKEFGMKGAKVKVGFGVGQDLRILRRARKAWEEGMLIADANGAYDAHTAGKACRLFKEIDLAWFEEPVISDDWEGYRMLKGCGVPIGAGEAWFGGDFRFAVERDIIDVLEPSVSRCGGIDVLVDAARLAQRAGTGFSPMTGANSGISLAASLHVASCFKSVGVETSPFPNPLVSELVPGSLPIRDGAMTVPTKPGLGIEVDEAFVKKKAG